MQPRYYFLGKNPVGGLATDPPLFLWTCHKVLFFFAPDKVDVMIKNSYRRRAGLFLTTLFILLFLSMACLARPYRPTASLTLTSEYAGFNDTAPPHTQIWQVVPTTAADTGVTLRFFPVKALEPEPVCEIFLPPTGGIGNIRLKKTAEDTEVTTTSGLLLTDGFPAPCDILPVEGDHEGRLFQQTRRAGGSVFTRNYRITKENFSLDDAHVNGWIRYKAALPSTLIMVTVEDEQGRMATRQLWPVDGDWWLYEETPLRRSWLIEE